MCAEQTFFNHRPNLQALFQKYKQYCTKHNIDIQQLYYKDMLNRFLEFINLPSHCLSDIASADDFVMLLDKLELLVAGMY